MTKETSTRRSPSASAVAGKIPVTEGKTAPPRETSPIRTAVCLRSKWCGATSPAPGATCVPSGTTLASRRRGRSWRRLGRVRNEERTEAAPHGADKARRASRGTGRDRLLPLEKGHLAAVAGMGRPGTFSRSRLEILTRALVGCVGLLPRHDTLATVLIGSGEGNSLKVPDCVDSILRTAVEVVGSDNRLNLARLQIVELHLDRALEVLDHVKLIAANLLPDQRNGDLEVLVQEQLQTALGGQIDTRFGCSMLLAALAEIAASGDDSKASLVNLLFAALPDDEVRSNVRNELLKAREKLTETQAAERIKVLARRFLIQRGGETTSQEIPCVSASGQTRTAFAQRPSPTP